MQPLLDDVALLKNGSTAWLDYLPYSEIDDGRFSIDKLGKPGIENLLAHGVLRAITVRPVHIWMVVATALALGFRVYLITIESKPAFAEREVVDSGNHGVFLMHGRNDAVFIFGIPFMEVVEAVYGYIVHTLRVLHKIELLQLLDRPMQTDEVSRAERFFIFEA